MKLNANSCTAFCKSAPYMPAISQYSNQRGVVLFIAMIALVVMSLAAVALIRSVDTNTLITSNMSFKQTSIASSSYGIESLSQNLYATNSEQGHIRNTAAGYYEVCTTTSSNNATCDGSTITTDATWQPGTRSRLADGLGITGGVDAYGNSIQYIVERMCTTNVDFVNQAQLVDANCLVVKAGIEGDPKNIPNMPLIPPPGFSGKLPVYRVTVRVSGPKNTVSFVQAFIS